jgi:hypothetical protein
VPYIGAGERAWGADSPHFAQLVKVFGALDLGTSRYTPAEIVDQVLRARKKITERPSATE